MAFLSGEQQMKKQDQCCNHDQRNQKRRNRKTHCDHLFCFFLSISFCSRSMTSMSSHCLIKEALSCINVFVSINEDRYCSLVTLGENSRINAFLFCEILATYTSHLAKTHASTLFYSAKYWLHIHIPYPVIFLR